MQAAGPGGIGRPASLLGLLSGETSRNNALIHASQNAQVMTMQHVRDALGTLSQTYAQTGNKAQSLAAMIRNHPDAFGDMFAAGLMKSPKDIDALLTMGATQGPGAIDTKTLPGVAMWTDAKGATHMHNLPLGADQIEQNAAARARGTNEGNPQYPRGTKLVPVKGPDGNVTYQWAVPGQPVQGTVPAKTGTQKAIDAQSMSILQSAPQLYGALNDINNLHLGGPAGTGTLTALGAKYGVAPQPDQILQAAKARIENALATGALSTKYAGMVRDWMKNVSPQNVWSQSYNSVLAQGLMRDTQRLVQARSSMVEDNIQRPLPPEVAQQLDNMGVRTKSTSLLQTLRTNPQSITYDEAKILAGGNYDLTPQDQGALRQIAARLSQAAAPSDGQEAAGGKGTMPSQSQMPGLPGAPNQQTQPETMAPPPAPTPQPQPQSAPTQPAQPPQPAGRPVPLPPATGSSIDPSQQQTQPQAPTNLVPGGALKTQDQDQDQ